RNADLYYFYDSWKTSEVVYGAGETVFSVSSSFFSYHGLRMRLLGEYQVFNASHALLCVEVLRQKGLFISECHIRQGLWKTLWPGRMELLRTNPLFFLDGAHNPDGAQAFCRSIQPYCRHHRLILIIGLLAKKEAASFIREVENFADVLWLTQPVSGKGTRAEQLAEAVSAKDKPLFVEPDFRKAVQGALAMARAQDVVAAVGSLYLAGDIKKYFTEAYEDD
ncbi:MAG: hypothetical protein LBT44_05155, partial [Clostridiales bacterium]|nr:hypothetical protein [Clostridiales bacterium]